MLIKWDIMQKKVFSALVHKLKLVLMRWGGSLDMDKN